MYINTCIYIYLCTCIHVYKYLHIQYLCTCIHVYKYVQIRTYMHVHTYTCRSHQTSTHERRPARLARRHAIIQGRRSGERGFAIRAVIALVIQILLACVGASFAYCVCVCVCVCLCARACVRFCLSLSFACCFALSGLELQGPHSDWKMF